MKNYKYGVKDAPILKFKWLGVEFLKKIVSDAHRKTIISYGQIKYPKTISDNSEYTKIIFKSAKI